ncbi:MAG TPA: diguanylate cyclase [Candidatus Polarisedimenticolia bacterium]|nr:diguanylate cyclase [Candidatus Polarisedimenticolia bacterium]
MSKRPASVRRPEEVAALRAEIEGRLNEDPSNLAWALDKVERLAWSSGPGLYADLLLMLFNLTLQEDAARRCWEAMSAHRVQMERSLGRPVPLRVAALDFLIEQNRKAAHPRLLDVVCPLRPSDGGLVDEVTGLRTAAFLREQLPREVARARRFKLDLSAVHVEIDDIAGLSERFGASTGTVLLQEVSGLIRSCIRDTDYAARTAAFEFELLLTETDRMGAYYVAERIRQKAEAFYLERRVGGRPFEATLSAGVASFPQDADGPEDLARKAREAFFTARARGRNRVAIHYRERREYMRLDLEGDALQVSLVPDSAGLPPATMKNISSGGVLFESPAPVELGRTVKVVCGGRNDAERVTIPGHVVRIERFEGESGPRYEIGVLFDLVVEEQLEGVIDFLERFISDSSDPAR